MKATDSPTFQEGDHVGIKRAGEIRRIATTDGGVVYVLMDGSDESELFAVYVDVDAYFIELITIVEDTNDKYHHI